MDKKILETLERLEKSVSDIKKVMATKSDLKNFATKDDLKSFVTKDQLFATKDELFERFDELDKMQMAIIESVDESKEDKTAVNSLEKRVDRLERKVFV